MEEKKDLIPHKSVVSESNALINSIYSLTIQEQRVILILISMVNPKFDQGFRVCKLPVKIFQKYVGLKGQGYYQKLDYLTDKLMQRFLKIPQADGGWEKVNWLERCKYHKKEGIVELEISKSLAPHLLDLRSHYTSYELLHVIHLKSTYSVRIYRLLKQYEKIKERYFEIEELKKILNIPPDQYKLYGHFKKKVLLKAQGDLKNKNNNSDISFKFIEKKGPRNKVIGIMFFIINNKYEDFVDVGDKLLPEKELIDSINNINIYLKLIDYGVSENVAKKLVNEYQEEQIIENLDYVEYKIKFSKDKIINLPGFVVDSIKNNWKHQIDLFDTVKNKMTKRDKITTQKKRDVEIFEKDLDYTYENVKRDAINEYLKTLPKNELEEINKGCMGKAIEMHGQASKKAKIFQKIELFDTIARRMDYPDIESWKEMERKKRPDLYGS